MRLICFDVRAREFKTSFVGDGQWSISRQKGAGDWFGSRAQSKAPRKPGKVVSKFCQKGKVHSSRLHGRAGTGQCGRGGCGCLRR